MQKHVKPKEGLIVRDPISKKPLLKEGSLVDWNGNSGRYWRRRVKVGDVSIVNETEPVKEEKQEEVEKVESTISDRTTSKRKR